MKKLIALMTVLCMVLSLAACEDSEPAGTGDPIETTAPPVDTTSPIVPADPGYTFTYNGTKIAMRVNAAELLAALGEPISYTEQASCAFTGLDKTYYYGSFYLNTYPVGDQDFVYGLWLVDDTVTTEEGLYIGATQAQVESIYGTEGFNGSNAYILDKGACRLTIILTDGLVSSIQYDAIF